jgi:protocatechuate 3,4-dioxygenase, beta subunit
MRRSMTRRRFLGASVGIGGFVMALPAAAVAQQPAGWIRPGGLVAPGEWWAGGGPRKAPAVCALVGPEEAGARLVLSGTVFGPDGRTPLPGVTVYAYQTDVHGLYNPQAASGVPHRIRGWANTGQDGRYEFHTIKPGAYPNRRTPAHIHVTVSRDDIAEWWLPEVRFEGDSLLTTADLEASAAAGRFGNVRPLVVRDGRIHCTHDLRI